jgi:ABC-type branched-subunit amino acid transport system substrate-binding protein
MYLEQGETDRALQYYDSILRDYPQWKGVPITQVNRLKALLMMGREQEVLQEGSLLWNTLLKYPEAQIELAQIMADAYQKVGNIENALEWLEKGSTRAQTQEEKDLLAQSALSTLRDADEATIRRLLEGNPSDTMRVFLEFRLAQMEMEAGETEAARERLLKLLGLSAQHPLALKIKQALEEAGGIVSVSFQPDRIGCLAPLSGPYEAYGRKIVRGLTLAAEDWNDGHPDDPITLVIKDTEAQPELALTALKELIEKEEVLAVVGPLSRMCAKRIAGESDQWNIPILSLTREEEETSKNPFVLNIFLNEREMIQALVRYCTEELGYSSFATLYPNDRTGMRLADIFSQVVEDSGGTFLGSIAYETNTRDFKDPIKRLIEMAQQNASSSGYQKVLIEGLFIPDQAQTVALIAPQLLYHNLVGTTLLGTNWWAEVDLVQVGGVYMEQAVFVTPFYWNREGLQVQLFRDKLQSLYQSSPSYLEAQAYDALMLLLHARHKLSASSIQPYFLLQKILQTRDYEGLAGVYSFTSRGDLERSYLIFQLLNGQIVQQFPDAGTTTPENEPYTKNDEPSF